MFSDDNDAAAQHRTAQHRTTQHRPRTRCCGWFPYKCEECGATFDRPEALGGHDRSGCS